MNTESLIAKYVEIRDLLKEREAERVEADKPYREAMVTIEGVLLMELNSRNEESVKTAAGTAYKATTMSAKVVDADALFNYVRESDDFSLLVAGVAKDAVRTHLDEHQGQLPPGVDVTYFTKLNVRRA